MKVHLHDEQFDGAWHPWCGRGRNAVSSDEFEATPPGDRCALCDREWFPHGQPDWHYQGARMRGKASGSTPLELARMVEAEAIHRAHNNLGDFLDEKDNTPAMQREIRRHLARHYNAMLEKFELDGLSLDESGGSPYTVTSTSRAAMR